MFTVTPKKAYDEIKACVSVGLVPMLTSSPGMGKSSIVHKLAKDYRLKLIDLRLSQCMPEDLQGFPMRNGNKASFMPFDLFPIEGDEVPEGYDGWLIFLDELTSATKPVQAAAYKLILDRMTGSHRLHEQVAMVAAGNKSTDRAVVNQLSTALQSRVIHYELEVSHTEWSDFAIQNGLDHRVTGYINFMPSKLMDFRPDHQDKTFPCPRTWEFLSRLVKDQDITPELGPRIAGTIGQGVAVEFITFAQEYARLPKLHDIIKDPENVAIPPEISTKYATVSMLMELFDEKNLDQILTYIHRFNIELQIIFYRGVNVRSPELRDKHNGFAAGLRKMVRYLG